MHMTAPVSTGPRPFASEDYWRRIFARNPDFCSWQSTKQAHVRDTVCACLNEIPGRLRVLDFGIGNLGLYRAFDDSLMQRISLTGITESQQHTAEDPLLARHRIRIETGPGLSPCARVSNSTQDCVVCTYVFAYLDAQTRADALACFARVLVPGGKLVLVLHHPRGERARKFRCAEPYWPSARSLYERLLEGRHTEARALLQALTMFLNETFGADEGYRRYLASYLKTAARFLETFCADEADATRVCAIPEAALFDCQDMQRLIDREWAMTCRSFHPIENPALELALPAELSLSDIVACIDPTCGSPIAYVVQATAV
jgi:SAM-dependent methyltransferase